MTKIKDSALMDHLDFAVVGAQKSGTTWLHECLSEHPEIFVPSKKELHFFCPDEMCRFSTKKNGFNWYLNQLKKDKESEKIVGELSTDYMFYPGVAKELARLNPDLKVIFILRNPIDRAYSAYWMWRRHNKNLGTFKEVFEENQSLLTRGLYWRQIESFLEYFGSSNISIQIYEEVVAQPEQKLAEIYSWLGVSPNFQAKVMHKKIGNTAVYPGNMGKFVYKALSRFLNLRFILPIWRQLRRRSQIKEKLVLITNRIFGNTEYPKISEKDRDELRPYFYSENLLLEKYLKRSDKIWQ